MSNGMAKCRGESYLIIIAIVDTQIFASPKFIPPRLKPEVRSSPNPRETRVIVAAYQGTCKKTARETDKAAPLTDKKAQSARSIIDS